MQGPFEVIARLGVNKHTKRPSEDDHKAAYLNALMWTLTGDEAHARKSIEILNAGVQYRNEYRSQHLLPAGNLRRSDFGIGMFN